MNTKKPFKSDWKPDYLREIRVPVGSRTYLVTRGMEVSVHGRINLPAGRYEFRYAEKTNVLTELLIYVEGPVRRSTSRVRTIRLADIKTVHLKTRD